jgi:hemerythrin HHE cation binding domain-containing protein
MTALRTHFLDDHQSAETRLESLLAALAANDHPNASHIWKGLESGLVAHLGAEETLLIPALLVARERDTRVLVQEHRHIRSRLKDLGRGLALGIMRPATLRDFLDEMRAHAKTEDRLLYQWADVHLDDEGRTRAIDALARTSIA